MLMIQYFIISQIIKIDSHFQDSCQVFTIIYLTLCLLVTMIGIVRVPKWSPQIFNFILNPTYLFQD